MSHIEVVTYDPAWPGWFEAIRNRVAPALEGAALAIEHVGSTSVPGLAAKPIIDIDVVVRDDDGAVAAAVAALATLGYVHRGDLGIPGREAFFAPAGTLAHHLYVCREGHASLRNHLVLRDYLRGHPKAAAAYGALKRRLAAAHRDDVESYIAGKAPFILGVLAASGFAGTELAAIAVQNGVGWPIVKRR
ncbi:MAG: GrpB family protein [Dehalococcoidia bacterium]